MDIQELRDIISNFPKYPGTKTVSPASVCNDGFPGTFNLSFTEPEWIKEFKGQYINYDHDFVYSKIQPCIRHQDWSIIKDDDENRFRYLSVFDMADIGGAISVIDGNKLDKIAEFSTKSLYDLLIHRLKLSSEKLRIKYCAGGNVAVLTKGKYPLDKVLEADPKIKLWLQLGIHENQFISNKTRDTLLALHIYGLPTPWGYRNEIFYEHRGKLLDIATFEYLLLRPIFDTNGNIKDLHKWEHCFVISAVGVERLLMIVNDYKTIIECPHIKPLLKMILSDANKKILKSAIILTEGIRAIHRIVSDAGDYKNLSKKRKQKIRGYYHGIFDSFSNLGLKINNKIIEKYFQKNAKLQPYYPELMQSVGLAVREVASAKSRFANDKTRKKRGCSSVVEHVTDNDEVGGAKPSIPTKNKK